MFAGEGAGGVAGADADLTVINSILWNNTATSSSQANSIVTMKSSCIEGGGWSALLGNISADPLFYDASSGDYSLSNGSNAADAGWDFNLIADTLDLDNDSNTAEELPLDLRGRTRSIDAGVPDSGVGSSPITDMGAYELCSGDFNRDGILDFFDQSDFLDAFNALDPDADINGDGVLNGTDVSDFLTYYSLGC